jgi:1,4-alpha-glucan branching enzyme
VTDQAAILPTALWPDLAVYLGRQRWYAGSPEPDPDGVVVAVAEELINLGRRGRLLWALVDSEGHRYQLLVGRRPADLMPERPDSQRPRAFVGQVGDLVYYDATVDPEMMIALAARLGIKARRVRPITAEQSNTSLILDDEVILKIFRQPLHGSNPDVEVTTALADGGFVHVAAPVATWERDGLQLAFAQQFLAGGVDGWTLALESVGRPAGGDFSTEAATLGRMTAELHVSLGEAFGVDHSGLSWDWGQMVDRLGDALASLYPPTDAGGRLLGRLAEVGGAGPAIRVHGDYHLGQVLRTPLNWYVLDFEGEPARSLAERRAPCSPLKDVAGMLRSFSYAANSALILGSPESDQGSEAGSAGLGELGPWETACRQAFLDGYLRAEGISELLPALTEDFSRVLEGFELEKAIYELAYEHAYRPDWVGIPRAAVSRLVGEAPGLKVEPQSNAVPGETMTNVGSSNSLPPSAEDLELLVAGRHGDPHRILGRHSGVVTAYRPDSLAMRLIVPGANGERAIEMTKVHAAGVWEAAIPDDAASYRLEADYLRPGGDEGDAAVETFAFGDPYRAWPTLGDLDLHLFGEGRHRRLWEVLGAHCRVHDSMAGVSFAVWAPNAHAARVVGDWNFWDGRVHQMRSLGSSGVWELFIPGVGPGARYKFELIGSDGQLHLKADPMAMATEVPPGTASVVAGPPAHAWRDAEWMAARADPDNVSAPGQLNGPMSIYEMHIGSWRHTDDGNGGQRSLSYLELADQLPVYLQDLGFTHVEFLPVAEHPFGGSWGYQVSAYYAPTARFGSADDFRVLVDSLHQAGIGVIVDWVPAHFPRDDFALARFDGTALYEHADPRQGTQPDWGTLVFNLGRNEVRNFLVANALFWLDLYHVDGLRVDAVASMLYLDYSRKEGEWIPNEFGGRENLSAVAFLKEVNEAVYGSYRGASTTAEESTAWPAVSRPTYIGGLGFGFKWNMGWMHDTLSYFEQDPIYRKYHHNELTFGLIYAWQENFVLPLSHDEVVHGKGALINKMPGDRWQQLANLRALFSWMWAHPGKQLVFMGAELAQGREWAHDSQLDWWLLQYHEHQTLQALVRELNGVYRSLPALWERDFSAEGFQWIDANDTEQSVLSFLRRGAPASGTPTVACIANLTPVPHVGYRIGLPSGGRWSEVLNSDAGQWGGGGMGNQGSVTAYELAWHGQPYSAEITLPPLAVLWLTPG